jgi:hypothetical protein
MTRPHGSVPEEILEARSAFVDRRCSETGWDPHNLTWAQITELRSAREWKFPLVVADPDPGDSGSRSKCECCGGYENVGSIALAPIPGEDPLTFDVCSPCEQSGRFRNWFRNELERCMVLDETMMTLPDEKWTDLPTDYENLSNIGAR